MTPSTKLVEKAAAGPPDANPDDEASRRRLFRRVSVKLVLASVLLGLILFLPAGTLRFWQAWLFLALLLGSTAGVVFNLAKHNPQLLERRLRRREKEPSQKLIVKLGNPLMAALLILPGFDRRWRWSAVPPVLVLAAVAVFLGAYFFSFRAMKINPHASRTVEVVPGQEVISTGPYALVRHPMYLAVLVMSAAIPLALGSYWALIAYLPMPGLLALRIRNEEEVLMRELPAYGDYRKKVRYKILPGIW